MLSNLYWYGLAIGSRWGWNPTTREGWAVALVCVLALIVASLVVSRTMRFLIAVGVIVALIGTGLLTGTMPG
jgi:hypothetical protein